jgi:hypothetical protein
MVGAGILTCCPSTSPFGCALGPDFPWADDPSPGTLVLTAKEILTPFIVTHAGIRTSTDSTCLSSQASLWVERSPTRAVRKRTALRSFGNRLEPRSFSAHRHSTSELLRTL